MALRSIERHQAHMLLDSGSYVVIQKQTNHKDQVIGYVLRPQEYDGKDAFLVSHHKTLAEARNAAIEKYGCTITAPKAVGASKPKMRDLPQNQKGYNAESYAKRK